MNELFDSLKPLENYSLWRFMDLFKFVDLITSKKLTLVNLTGMKDPYEGILHSSIEIQSVDLSGKIIESPQENLSEMINNVTRQILFISCWHESNFESASMWNSYGNENGIAIKTNVNRLKKAIKFENYSEMELLRVNYFHDVTDYYFPNRKENHIYTALLNKRASFDYEKEVRLIWHPRDYSNESIIRKIDVDLFDLIECIYVSPLFNQWQLNSIKNLLDKLNITIPIIKSELYDLK